MFGAVAHVHVITRCNIAVKHFSHHGRLYVWLEIWAIRMDCGTVDMAISVNKICVRYKFLTGNRNVKKCMGKLWDAEDESGVSLKIYNLGIKWCNMASYYVF